MFDKNYKELILPISNLSPVHVYTTYLNAIRDTHLLLLAVNNLSSVGSNIL